MNLFDIYNLSSKEKELIRKVEKMENIEYDEYISTIKNFCQKYKNSDKLDNRSNNMIYIINRIYYLYKDNEFARGTPYFKKNITFSAK